MKLTIIASIMCSGIAEIDEEEGRVTVKRSDQQAWSCASPAAATEHERLTRIGMLQILRSEVMRLEAKVAETDLLIEEQPRPGKGETN